MWLSRPWWIRTRSRTRIWFQKESSVSVKSENTLKTRLIFWSKQICFTWEQLWVWASGKQSGVSVCLVNEMQKCWLRCGEVKFMSDWLYQSVETSFSWGFYRLKFSVIWRFELWLDHSTILFSSFFSRSDLNLLLCLGRGSVWTRLQLGLKLRSRKLCSTEKLRVNSMCLRCSETIIPPPPCLTLGVCAGLLCLVLSNMSTLLPENIVPEIFQCIQMQLS